MQLVLRGISVVSFIVAIVWVIQVRALEPEPILAFLSGLTALALSFAGEKKEGGETLDQHNRRVMLNHVENFWVKGVLEKSLHGAALLELGIKENPAALKYPWTIKKEATNETLPAGKSMLEIFNEIGAGRSLLILGAPGSGKTTMLLELARQLIEQARKDETEPIPVVFNLASWTEKLTMTDWLADQLNIVYYVPKKTAPRWVSENKMLLLLDGLDEVKQERRSKCVEAINLFRTEHGLTSLVVCSRIEEYQAINSKLSLEGAIALQPLMSKQVDAYFDRFGKSLASAKQLLRKDKALRELAETPLMLSIITLAYKDKKTDEFLASKNKGEWRKHIFDNYIMRMLDRQRLSRYNKQHILFWLSQLARRMIIFSMPAIYLENLDVSWLPSPNQQKVSSILTTLILGLLFGCLMGLTSVFLGYNHIWVINSIFYGGVSSLFIFPELITNKIKLTTQLGKWSWPSFSKKPGMILMIYSVFAGIGVWLFFGQEIEGAIFGSTTTIGLLVLIVFLEGRKQAKLDPDDINVIRKTIINSLILFFGYIFLLIMVLFSFHLGLSSLIDHTFSKTYDNLSGISISEGLFLGIIGGIYSLFILGQIELGGVALVQYYVLQFMLYQNRYFPFRLITFLEDMSRSIILRKVGGGYSFIHISLLEHFAEMEVEQA